MARAAPGEGGAAETAPAGERNWQSSPLSAELLGEGPTVERGRREERFCVRILCVTCVMCQWEAGVTTTSETLSECDVMVWV